MDYRLTMIPKPWMGEPVLPLHGRPREHRKSGGFYKAVHTKGISMPGLALTLDT